MLRFVLGFVCDEVVVGGVVYIRRRIRRSAMQRAAERFAASIGMPVTSVRFVDPDGFERLLQDMAADAAAEDGAPPKDKLN